MAKQAYYAQSKLSADICVLYMCPHTTIYVLEWDHIQNQLTLRVKPIMRMPPPRMRSLQDEIHEKSRFYCSVYLL